MCSCSFSIFSIAVPPSLWSSVVVKQGGVVLITGDVSTETLCVSHHDDMTAYVYWLVPSCVDELICCECDSGLHGDCS